MKHRARSGRSVPLAAAAVVAGLLVSGGLVWQASSAAFTASTQNGSNTWSSGQVLISDNDGGTAMWTATGLVPGSTGTNCIEVTYGGNVASAVKLYATPYTGTLGQYITMEIEEGSGVSCAVPGTYTSLNPGPATLDAFVTAPHNTYGTGVSSWEPSATATRPYRFTYTLQDNNSAQNKSAAVTFVWEARSKAPV